MICPCTETHHVIPNKKEPQKMDTTHNTGWLPFIIFFVKYYIWCSRCSMSKWNVHNIYFKNLCFSCSSRDYLTIRPFVELRGDPNVWRDYSLILSSLFINSIYPSGRNGWKPNSQSETLADLCWATSSVWNVWCRISDVFLTRDEMSLWIETFVSPSIKLLNNQEYNTDEYTNTLYIINSSNSFLASLWCWK